MQNPERRRFLNRVALAAGTISVGASPLVALAADSADEHLWRGRRRLVRPAHKLFPQSVASFEPRPDGVILWTRLNDESSAGQNVPIVVLVSRDRFLRNVIAATDLTARAEDNGVVQVKLTGLSPKTRYYYRFVVESHGRWLGSQVGRTQTAPVPSDNVRAKFAVASCQDAIGRFYNAYLPLIVQDLDFIVHVGDYIYETTGDPSFQSTTGRRPEFSDVAGAIALQGAGGVVYYAAASLSNYRELHRFYRDDPVLQRLHERFPFVIIWDDHEYSDDCWGATGTYFAGRRDEFNVERRRNAERAFFEYIAVDDDIEDGELDLSRRPLYPDTRIYRDFRYGSNLQLFLTDYRTFRPDHLIPEDAFPGTIAVDQASLLALGVPSPALASFSPYVDFANLPPALLPAFQQVWIPVLTGVLTAAYVAEGLDAGAAATHAAEALSGPVDVTVLNQFLAAYNALPSTQPKVPLIEGPVVAALPRGLSYALIGKTSLFSTVGARYFVVKDTYDLLAAYRAFIAGEPDAQNAYGDAQREWLERGLRASGARWKIVANSTALTSMVLDLSGNISGLPPQVQQLLQQLPAALRNRFYLNVDQFDGFPQYKQSLLQLYRSVPNVALLAGDIHASFVTEHTAPTGGSAWEFVAPAVSSFTFRSGVIGYAEAIRQQFGLPDLSPLIALLDVFLAGANRDIRYVDTSVNGVVVLEASAARLAATYFQLDGSNASESLYEQPLKLLKRLRLRHFEVPASPGTALATSAAEIEAA